MKKQIIIALGIALAMSFTPQVSSAQGILGKVKKGIEKVNKAIDGTNDKAALAVGAAVKQEDGVIVQNPMSSHFEVILVGAYGVSKSENYGDVELVFKVMMKDPLSRIRIGGNTNFYHTIAYDADGNTYKPHHDTISKNYDVTEGIAVRIVHNDGYQFENVRKSATVFPVLKVGFNGSNWENGEVTFKNVPVQWDVEH